MRDVDALANPSVPASAGAMDGASGGAFGDCSAADLRRGYTQVPCEADKGSQCGCPECTASRKSEGFLGRPDPYTDAR